MYNKGERKSLPLVGLSFVKSKQKKIGFSVPNKVGCAVVRNRLKRQLRAIMRQKIIYMQGAQVVFSLRVGADKLNFSELSKSIDNLLRRAKLIQNEKIS